MGEARRKSLALRGALLQARAAVEAGDMTMAAHHLAFALNETASRPAESIAPDPEEVFAAEFEALCERHDMKACAVIATIKRARVGAGLGADGIIRAGADMPVVNFRAHGDKEVAALLFRSMKGGAPE